MENLNEQIADNENVEVQNVDEVQNEVVDESSETLDDKERAIIKYKKKYKEAVAELEEFRRKELEEETSRIERQRVAELKDSGKSQDEAEEQARKESELNRLRIENAKLQIKDLETKYPGISNKTLELIRLHKEFDGKFSYEELYRLKFQNNNMYEEKTRQEVANKQSSGQTLPNGSNVNVSGGKKPVKLTEEQERVYQIMVDGGYNISREEFLKYD